MSRLPSVLSIVPHLPPTISGVGDYAFHLAQQLHQDFGIKTHFIVGDCNWQNTGAIADFSTEELSDRAASALQAALLNHPPTRPVLLHYVNYGYAKRGCPWWLIEALEQWKKQTPNAQLVTMFHELIATEPPWRSGFWLAPIHRELASRVACLSDRCITSAEQYAKILQTLSQQKHVDIPSLPVFSGIAEPQSVLPLSARKKRLVIFGQAGNRRRVYRHSQQVLRQICQRLQIEEILDIGMPTGLELSAIGTVPIVALGKRPTAEISEILSTSIAGFLHYYSGRLAKSTIFAAYCAHGLLPICHRPHPDIDGLQAGQQYWTLNGGVSSPNSLQAVADSAYAWYQTHQLSTQAKTFADCFAAR